MSDREPRVPTWPAGPQGRWSGVVRKWFAATTLTCALGGAGCATATVRRQETPTREYPAGVTSLRWRVPVHEHDLFEPRPEECATGVVVKDAGGERIIIGSRAGRVQALDVGDGHLIWSTPISGGADSEARFDDTQNQVYVGTDDGFLYALDPQTGAVRWSYKGRGAMERLPEVGGDAIYVASASDRIVALESRTGRVRWQYERESPEGFSIHGYAGPRLHNGLVYTGFSDGYVVALNAGTGEPVWARSLAAASEQYVDVDSTPSFAGKNLLVAASYSGGLYGLSPASGEVKWRVGVEGAGTVSVIGDRLYFAAPRDGVTALTDRGEILWRQGLAEAGDLTSPIGVGPYLIFSGSRAGLFVVDRSAGKLLEVFNPGRGMCGAPAVSPDGRRLYALANSGTLYALELRY